MASRKLLVRVAKVFLCTAVITLVCIAVWYWWRISFSMKDQRFATADHVKTRKLVAARNCGSRQDAIFQEFFNDSQIAEFMEVYKNSCLPSRLLFAALLSNAPPPHRNPGFGSFLNIASTIYMAATEPAMKANRQFQFIIHGWKYETLTSFFTDFAAGTNCPLFRDVEDEEFYRLEKSLNHYTAKFENNSLKIVGSEPSLIVTYSREYDALKDEMQQALGRDGTEAFFIKKSLLMKSLWQPKPLLKELLRILWTALTDGSGGYVAVHIRRYDKLWVEASAIPISVFADKIKGLCESAVSRCPKSIFVMYDDEAAFLELERLLGSTFQVFDLARLVKYVNLDVSDYVITSESVNSLKHWLPVSRRDFWNPHTTQLVIEITLLALADQVVCTYSSNICRIVALLKGRGHEDIHSLDRDWYPW